MGKKEKKRPALITSRKIPLAVVKRNWMPAEPEKKGGGPFGPRQKEKGGKATRRTAKIPWPKELRSTRTSLRRRKKGGEKRERSSLRKRREKSARFYWCMNSSVPGKGRKDSAKISDGFRKKKRKKRKGFFFLRLERKKTGSMNRGRVRKGKKRKSVCVRRPTASGGEKEPEVDVVAAMEKRRKEDPPGTTSQAWWGKKKKKKKKGGQPAAGIPRLTHKKKSSNRLPSSSVQRGGEDPLATRAGIVGRLPEGREKRTDNRP